ncbi:tyrosine-type recombinase/integrase [Cruoricaptor ignavus]|uniref:Tyrosine-type recombinase/integrase n=1 Tax=Cruoricaptor ignavus TaxID=1118202 RepID=A0A7M1T5Q9_9FLAO|nr:site-specific integrase [Cruoricaptor ignavus]QOR74637.1 tyrosine-type recombinase/integrase [Cruoricaptor ignavus]
MTRYHGQFLLDKEKGKSDARLRYRVKWEGNIVAFNVGYRVEIDKWSTDTQRCKINTTHGKKKISASIINRNLTRFEDALDKISHSGHNFSVTDFKEAFNSLVNKNGKSSQKLKSKSLFDFYDDFIQEEGRNRLWTESTYAKLKTNKNHIFEFNSSLKMSDINDDLMQNLQFFLQDTKGFRNSTVEKQISFFKWFLRWAKRKDIMKDESAIAFKPKLKKTQKTIVFLTQAELKQLKEYSPKDGQNYLRRVKDIFLFQCFTGLRFSDVINLKNSDLQDGVLLITTIKTSDLLRIDLNDYSKEIVLRYYNPKHPNLPIFPTISNQKMNEYLQQLAKDAQINEPVRQTFYMGNKRCEIMLPKHEVISSHAGRRTFICNALSIGIPAHVVMKWTGHSDYKAMKPYIEIADEIKVDAMAKFNGLF